MMVVMGQKLRDELWWQWWRLVAAVGVLFKLEIIIDVIVWWMFGQRLRSRGDDLEAVVRSGWGWWWVAGDGDGLPEMVVARIK
ncbi:hypothetical protein Tco_1161787 [Tanacetum coccineum]